MDNEFKYELADHVKIKGIESRAYQIVSQHLEAISFADESNVSEKAYTVLDVWTGDTYVISEEAIVEKTSQPNTAVYNVTDLDLEYEMEDDYVTAVQDANEDGIGYHIDYLDEAYLKAMEAFEKSKGELKMDERKLTPREQSSIEAEKRKQDRKDKSAKVDELLDALNDFTALADAFGDSEHYQSEITRIKSELTELSK